LMTSPVSAAMRGSPGMLAHLSEEPLSGTDDELGFSLPRAEEPIDYPVEASLVSEMSDRTLKHWLQRFANDCDELVFSSQYHLWTDNGTGVAPQEVVACMLRCGLDDCRHAASVTSALDLLLRQEGLPPQAVELALADYSEEDLEDLQLDNPRAIEFVTDVRTVLAKLPEDLPPPRAKDKKSTSAVEGTAAVRVVANAVHERKDEERTESYEFKELLEVRKALLQTGEIESYSGPRWITETATKLFAPMPLWQQQRMSRGTSEGGSAPSGEWRDAQRRNADRRHPEGRKKGSKQKEAPIPVSDSSWVAQLRRWKEDTSKKDDGEESRVDEVFLRELRLTLNKLTVEKFDNLSDYLILLISKSTRPNRGIPVLMQLVFEKATTQHHFIDMYVNLCVKLHQWLMANNDIVRVESQTNFKRILLNQCQNSFEQYLEPPESLEGLEGDSLYEAQVKYKTKMLGNIKLVGQLIRHGMLSPKIALSVAAELVRDDPIVRDERLETLAVFLETIGPSLDDPNWSHSQQFETIFAEVQRLVNDRTVPSRIRYLLRDVLDLRKGKWLIHKVRKFDEDAPTTIAEVHEKAKILEKTGGKGANSSNNSTEKNRRKGPGSSPLGSPKARPLDSLRARNLTSPPGKGGRSLLESPRDSGGEATSSSVRKPLILKPASTASQLKDPSPADAKPTPKDDILGGLQRAIAVAATRASKPKQEILADFHKEVALIIRQVGNGITVSEGVQRLRECSLPSDCVQEEVVDLIARMVDEPRDRRQHMFPLLKDLFDAGVFSPPGLLSRAVTSFIEDAFVDPGSVDPPDLVDIVLRELFPALGLDISALSFTPCVAEIFAEIDDGR
jgi:hypothetical protein